MRYLTSVWSPVPAQVTLKPRWSVQDTVHYTGPCTPTEFVFVFVFVFVSAFAESSKCETTYHFDSASGTYLNLCSFKVFLTYLQSISKSRATRLPLCWWRSPRLEVGIICQCETPLFNFTLNFTFNFTLLYFQLDSTLLFFLLYFTFNFTWYNLSVWNPLFNPTHFTFQSALLGNLMALLS